MDRPCPLCGAAQSRGFAEIDDRRYFRCDRCWLTFLDPAQLPDRAVERATYDLHQNDPADPRYRAFLDRLITPLLAHLRPGMVGLDFGCGPGPTVSVMLAERGLEVTDYDPIYRPDPRALERTYDFVTCTEVIEHLHRPGEELGRIERLLRPGGWFGVTTEVLGNDERFAGWWYRRDPTHVAFYRRETFGWIAKRFDWKVAFPARTVVLFQRTKGIGSSSPS